MLTEAQKKERLLGIGGSDVAAVAGLSKYKSPLDIYLIKIQEREDNSTSMAARVGSLLENDIANEYASKRGVEIYKPELPYVHPEYYWMRCNLDFVVKGLPILGECKMTSLKLEWGEEGTDDMPVAALLQCAHNAIVYEGATGNSIEQVDVPVLFNSFGTYEHKIYKYSRNKKLESNIIDMTRKFWKEHVEPRIPPQPKTLQEAALLWNFQEEKVEIASDEALKAINMINSIKSQIKELENKETTYKLQICKLLKDAEASKLVDDSGKNLATWNPNNVLDKEFLKMNHPELYKEYCTEINTESFKKSHPELYKEFTKKSATRVLRIA